MKNILLLLLSLFVVSCSTTSYVRESESNRINYFSSCPTISTTLNIVYTPAPVWHTQYYVNNIYTNHWPYTNNVYSNDYYGYYGQYNHYYLPYYQTNYYPYYYTPHYINWNNSHNYQYSNVRHRREVNSTPIYNTPRQNNSGTRTNTTPRSNYSTPRTNTTQNTNYNTPRPRQNNSITPRVNNNNSGGRTSGRR